MGLGLEILYAEHGKKHERAPNKWLGARVSSPVKREKWPLGLRADRTFL